MLKIQLLLDNPNSWIVPYAYELSGALEKAGHSSVVIHKHEEVESGDILCLLACEKIFKNLDLNKHNLVVHESDLPKGKGWSPVTWQILEGKNRIPVTLFEAVDQVDAGVIYDQTFFELEGDELLLEIKEMQGRATIRLILNFVDSFPNIGGREQVGEPTFYAKRTQKDSELDISKSIEEQFDLLRVCDNEKYPAFFKMKGTTYDLKIYRKDDKKI